MRNDLEMWQFSIGMRPSPKAEKLLHYFPMLDNHWTFVQKKWWTQSQTLFEKIFTSLFDNLLKLWIFQNCLSIQFCVSNWKWRESQLAGFLFPDSRTERPHPIEICYEWLKRIEDDLDVMECAITGDKSWIHHFDPVTKQESIHWKSPQSPVKKKILQAKLMNKVRCFKNAFKILFTLCRSFLKFFQK